jgi:three-Cys-motif partner protein
MMVRISNAWALDKLAIVECYVNGFSLACSGQATWQVVDGFAGPGVNRIKATGELVWGTPMVCAAASPEVPAILAMDLGIAEIEALTARSWDFRDRVTVRRGDVNHDLLPAMRDELSPTAPTLCILDPEGMELDFETIGAISEFRRGRTKAEVLVLLPTHTGFLRTLTEKGGGFDWAPERMDRMFGTTSWRTIWDRRQAGMSSEEATAQYVRLYGQQLERLGYTHVLDRQIRERGREGRLGYYLMFASQHPVGGRVMDHCFDTRYSAGEEQLGLFNLPRVSHLKP